MNERHSDPEVLSGGQRAYHVKKFDDGRVRYRRTSGKTWEMCGPFEKRTDASANVPMTLMIGVQGLWLMRWVPRTRLKDTVTAQGTKAELWEQFLSYIRMYASGD